MDRKGQITLEIIIMLLLVLNIYLYVSSPLGSLSKAATRDVGIAALAVQTVDQIAQKANMVALSGKDSRDYLEIRIMKEYQRFECNDKAVRLVFSNYTAVGVDNPPGLGIHALLQNGSRTYPAPGAFNLYTGIGSCNLSSLSAGDYTACVCFKTNWDDSNDNLGPQVAITAFEKQLGGCNCP